MFCFALMHWFSNLVWFGSLEEVKTQFTGPHSQLNLRWDQTVCICKNFPGDADGVGPGIFPLIENAKDNF